MGPRPNLCLRCQRQYALRLLQSRRLATAAAITPAADPSEMTLSPPPIARFPPTQPPSHKPPEKRQSQLIRQYSSLLRATPLILFYAHFNLLSKEWMAMRRELPIALQRCDEETNSTLGQSIKIQVIQTRIFEVALRLVEYYNPPSPTTSLHPSDPSTQSSADTISNVTPISEDPLLTHSLSTKAHDAVLHLKGKHPLAPLLAGPLALVTFPEISPAHLKAVLQFLSPDRPGGFSPPTRRAMPGYYDPPVQNGLQKLMLLGARVEGKVFDRDAVKRVGGLPSMDGLRAQLIALLGAAGGQLVQTLDGAGKSLWLTMESRRRVLEGEQNGKKE